MAAKKKVPVKKKAVKKKRTVSKRQIDRDELADRAAWPWPLRPYQEQARLKVDQGVNRLLLAWHRRAGKDVFGLSLARNQSMDRVGSYVHFFPKHTQAKRAIWNGVDPKQKARFIDVAFADQEVSRNNTDMFIEMHNGSTWQLLGSDNYDRIVGGNIVGAVFSEFALCDPRAWDYIRPMILENNGTVVFISTFRGRNHMWEMSQNLKNNPEWYVDIMPANDPRSVDIDGNPILSEAMIQSERDSGMSEALIQQEYYCNPQAASDGAIYGPQVERLRNDPLRSLADWDSGKPVYCLWNFDIPLFASYIIIQPGDRPVILDAGHQEFTSIGECIAHVENDRWPIQKHYITAPQRKVAAAMYDFGVRPHVMPARNEFIATTQTAALLDRIRLDGERCELLLDAISGYARNQRFNAQTATVEFGPDPVMSWHWRLAYPLECFASLAYDDSPTWGKKPDYSAQDRAIRTLS